MKILAAILLALTLSACGSFQQTTQVDEKSYIQFSGEPDELTVKLNGQDLGNLDDYDSFDLEGIEATRFEVNPGTHTVEVIRSGTTIIKRKVYVSDGNVFEVKLP